MKIFAVALLAVLLFGCSSIQTDKIIPLPSATPFDYHPMLREAYLDAYQDGYRASSQGIKNPHFRRGPYPFARELGFRAGAMDAANPPGSND